MKSITPILRKLKNLIKDSLVGILLLQIPMTTAFVDSYFLSEIDIKTLSAVVFVNNFLFIPTLLRSAFSLIMMPECANANRQKQDLRLLTQSNFQHLRPIALGLDLITVLLILIIASFVFDSDVYLILLTYLVVMIPSRYFLFNLPLGVLLTHSKHHLGVPLAVFAQLTNLSVNWFVISGPIDFGSYRLHGIIFGTVLSRLVWFFGAKKICKIPVDFKMKWNKKFLKKGLSIGLENILMIGGMIIFANFTYLISQEHFLIITLSFMYILFFIKSIKSLALIAATKTSQDFDPVWQRLGFFLSYGLVIVGIVFLLIFGIPGTQYITISSTTLLMIILCLLLEPFATYSATFLQTAGYRKPILKITLFFQWGFILPLSFILAMLTHIPVEMFLIIHFVYRLGFALSCQSLLTNLPRRFLIT